jgi:hypothetical protein
MSKIDQLKAEIESLPGDKFAEIFRWLSEKDWERWDKELKPTLRPEALIFWGARPAKRSLRGLSRTNKCFATPRVSRLYFVRLPEGLQNVGLRFSKCWCYWSACRSRKFRTRVPQQIWPTT